MAFPTIPTTGASRVLTNTQADTSGTRTFPSLTGLTKNSGDLLIAICVVYQSSAAAGAVFGTWGGGFTEFLDVGGTTSNMSIGAAYKWSTGSETGTFTVTQAATVTGHAAMILLSIPGAHASTPPEGGTIVNGTGSAADIAALNPSGWASEDALWIAVAGSGETSTTGNYTGIASGPTDYTGYVDTGISADVVGGVEAAVAFRQLAAASDDPGAFSVDVAQARNSAVLLAVRPAPAPINKTITTATETDAVQAVSKAKVKAIAFAGSAATAMALSFIQGPTYSLTPVAETDLANAIVALQTLPAAETSAAQALSFSQVSSGEDIVAAAETDAAQALDHDKAVDDGESSETTSALALDMDKRAAVTVASETDTAQTVTFAQASDFDLSPALETDAAQAIGYSQAGAVDITVVSETDAAQVLSTANVFAVAPASETDLANEIVALRVLPASETDQAQSLSYEFGASTDYDITLVSESDSVQARTASKSVTLPEFEASPPFPYNTVAIGDTATAVELTVESGAATVNISPALETDSVQTADKDKRAALTVAAETDSAQTVTYTGPQIKTLTLVAETDSALTLTYSQAGSFSIAPALESDAAQTLDVDKPIHKTVSTATETTSAQALTFSQATAYPIVRASETDTAQSVAFTKTIHKTLTVAAETDTAQALPFGGAYFITEATETDTAAAFRYAAMPPSGTLTSTLTGRIRQTRQGRVRQARQGVLS